MATVDNVQRLVHFKSPRYLKSVYDAEKHYRLLAAQSEKPVIKERQDALGDFRYQRVS